MQTYTSIIGSLPSPLKAAFKTATIALVAARLAFCPPATAKGTIYYIDPVSGVAGNNGLSSGAPKDFASIAGLISASNGGIGILIKQGTTYRATAAAILVNKPGIAIGTYTTGPTVRGRPIITRFQTSGSNGTYASAGWTLSSGDLYSRPETNDTGWIRDLSSPLGIAYQKMTSSAAVGTTPLSFFWSANVLYVNAGVGVSPNTKNYEIVVSNLNSGVEVSADGCRVEGLECHGFYTHRTDFLSQYYAFKSSTGNTDECVFVNCRGYYCNYHVMAHYQGAAAGGISTWIRCNGGYAGYSNGCSVFNAYSASGGHEVIFYECQCDYGGLPSSDWYSATVPKTGLAWYAHTGGGNLSLCLVYRFRAKDNPYGYRSVGYASNLPTTTLVTDGKCIDFEGVYEGGFGVNDMNLAPAGHCRVNGRYYFKPPTNIPGGTLALGSGVVQAGLVANCIFDVDMVNVTTWVGMYNSTGPNVAEIYFSAFTWRNITDQAGMNAATLNGTTTADAGMKFKNNIVQRDGTFGGAAVMSLALGNTSGLAGRIDSNAYSGVSTTNPTSAHLGISSDTHAVILPDAVIVEQKPDAGSPLWHTGTQNVLSVDFDINGAPRDNRKPSIGPVAEYVRITPAGMVGRSS